jgi:hypothetical protein
MRSRRQGRSVQPPINAHKRALPGKILVVDDEPRILRFVVRGSQAEGFTVDSADNGADGLRRRSTLG